MPLVRIDVPDTLSHDTRRAVADGVHSALVEAIGIPADDRFQVVTAHPAGGLIADPNYMGISRGAGFLAVQVFLRRGRSDELKRALYAAIVRNLARNANIRPEDVLIALTENELPDWSFGNGIAQYAPG
ncbi:MAG: tautomerase family protein [Alphaproteobacteria bacterium]|nr:tautomerase family protein [Alphaproteobacteria bacterium]